MESLYDVLEVSKNASKEVIEKAYKVLVKKYHPDVSNDKKTSENMIKKINDAYFILSNDERRKMYDLSLSNEDKVSNKSYAKSKYDYLYEHTVKKIKINNTFLIILIICSVILLIFVISILFNDLLNFLN